MGVDRTDYIIYGWKFPFLPNAANGDSIEHYEDLTLADGEIILEDCYADEYVVFGLEVLSGGDKYEGWNFEELELAKFDSEKMKSRYRELFQELIEGDLKDPTLFIFTHFH